MVDCRVARSTGVAANYQGREVQEEALQVILGGCYGAGRWPVATIDDELYGAQPISKCTIPSRTKPFHNGKPATSCALRVISTSGRCPGLRLWLGYSVAERHIEPMVRRSSRSVEWLSLTKGQPVSV